MKKPKKDKSIFTDVERELIMADIAFLKQKEIESGDWDKWKKAQRLLGWRGDPQEPNNAAPRRRVVPRSGEITREMFITATGREPINDDLDRCNCSEEGKTGHTSCGWCPDCNGPRFMCIHPRRRRTRT